MNNEKKAVVLSSGGLDSTTVMALARSEGYALYSLSFRYGQRHALELEAAQRVARALGAQEHLVINIDLGKIGGSALTENRDVPKGREELALHGGNPGDLCSGAQYHFPLLWPWPGPKCWGRRISLSG